MDLPRRGPSTGAPLSAVMVDVALYQAKKAGRDQVQAWYPGMALVP